jgi:hypothetical protein
MHYSSTKPPQNRNDDEMLHFFSASLSSSSWFQLFYPRGED